MDGGEIVPSSHLAPTGRKDDNGLDGSLGHAAMQSIFSRLYARGERPDRSQLEDYLTEVFASLFDRLDERARRSLLHALIKESARECFDSAVPYIDDAELVTQFILDASGRFKRPDMVLRRGGRYILVIEAKLGAAIARHVDHDATDNGISATTVSQLHTYSKWIAGRNALADSWPGAVILLTAWTAPPTDFPSRKTDGAFETVRSWTNVATWIVNNKCLLDPLSSALCSDLLTFLREKNLLDRHFNSRDLAAYTMFATSEDALRHTFRKAIEAVSLANPTLGKYEYSSIGIDGGMSVYWGWIILNKNFQYRNSRFYIAVGLCAEPGIGFGDGAVEFTHDEPFFLAYFGDENLKQRPAERVSMMPAGWVEITKGRPALIATKPVRLFSGNPDRRAQDLQTWASEQVSGLAAVLLSTGEPTTQV